ncbi:MAG TPA: hypothetical protein VMT00_14450 [Thermoanaerobaculia bacterium]|nr:hypothetical protein [Thermoanaerobaculia bacterium]
MPTEVDESRDLARAFWSGKDAICPKHGVKLAATFTKTTYFDHLTFECPKGKETIIVPQRPRQVEYNRHQIEGLVVFRQQGDNILCYRCQAKLQVEAKENPVTGTTAYTFTCVRCFSFGTWEGKPEEASIVGVSELLARN